MYNCSAADSKTKTEEATRIDDGVITAVLRGLTCMQSMRLPRIGSSLSCSERSWLISCKQTRHQQQQH
jgi:hypothetical protein